MSEYRFERLGPDRLKDLRFLMADAFGREVSLEYLRMRFDTAALGARDVGFIAYAPGGEPAAYYGVFPCKIEFEGRRILAAQSGDTMTHSRHRGRGLFIQLARRTYELCRELGIELVFGFPNENSHHGFEQHLNWVCAEKLRKYAITVPAVPFARWAKKTAPTRALYAAWARLVISFWKVSPGPPLANSCIGPGIGRVERSAEFYRYKEHNGSFFVSAGGARAWIRAEDALWLGDLERGPDVSLDRALASLKRLAFLLGLRRIVFQSSPGAFWEREFAARFAAEDSLPIGFMEVSSGLPMERIRFVQGDMDIF